MVAAVRKKKLMDLLCHGEMKQDAHAFVLDGGSTSFIALVKVTISFERPSSSSLDRARSSPSLLPCSRVQK